MDDEELFNDRTVVSAGLKTEADYLECKALLAAGKLDEALFRFQLSKDRLHAQLKEWSERLLKDL